MNTIINPNEEICLVSLADTGIYEEVSGRPFLNQYVYERLMATQAGKEEWVVEEWKDALLANEMLNPIDITEEVLDNSGILGKLKGLFD